MTKFFGPVTLNKKNLVIAALILFCLLYLFYRITPHKPALPPRTVIAKALNLTAQADKYTYQLEMKTSVNGKEAIYTEIEGWKTNKNKLRIKGKITDSEIEFYQLGDTTYTKDQVSGEWIKIVDNQLNQEEIFAAELNPLANFAYKELMEITYDGIVDDREAKVWKYTASPIVDNSYLEILWKDFVYELWIDRGSGRLTKAIVTAKSKNNPADKLHITVLFDYEQDFELKPPI